MTAPITFLWPNLLWLLLLLPLVVLLYLFMLRRKRKLAARLPSLALLRQAAAGGLGWRKHVPPLLFLLGLAAMLIAVARPASVILVPSQHETIILAMDVSGSMKAADVQPNRLTASQVAAKAFIETQPRHVKIGIVSFASTASVAQAPTTNREDLNAAIERFQVQRGTALGSAIVVSMATLFPGQGYDVTQMLMRDDRRLPPGARPPEKKAPQEKAEPGSYPNAVIVLLTDGQRTTGPDPMETAKLAADRGVRVYTVGVGTTTGETLGFEGWSMRVKLDEETLKNIATVTRGEYFHASSANELKRIYESMKTRFVMERKETEVSGLFAGLGALLAAVAAMLSMAWFNRIL